MTEYALRLLDDAVFEEDEQAEALSDFLPAYLGEDASVAAVVEALLATKAARVPHAQAPAPAPAPVPAPAPPPAAAPARPRFRKLTRADIGLDVDDGDGDQEGAAATRAAADDQPVCRHFLAGECLRADCPFSHDVGATVCRFWLQGRCVKGDSCEFRHAAAVASGADQNAGDTDDDDAALAAALEALDAQDSAMFPALSDREAASAPAPLPYALVGRIARLHEAFPWVPPEFLRDALLRTDGDVAAATEHVRADFPRPVDFAAAPRSETLPTAATPSRRSPAGGRYLCGAATPHPSLWVDTGAAVSQLYKRLRQEAIDHAEQRNKLFQAATAAYRRGDGAAARALSREGRWHHDRMQELHDGRVKTGESRQDVGWVGHADDGRARGRCAGTGARGRGRPEASLALFDERNPAGGAHGSNEPIIDLHGLHVNEGMRGRAGRVVGPDAWWGRTPGGAGREEGTGSGTRVE